MPTNQPARIGEVPRAPRPPEVAKPMRESRRKVVEAANHQWQELEDELQQTKDRVDHFSRELEAAEVRARGFKMELGLEQEKSAAYQRERDAAVRERIRLETIFGTLCNLMTQAGFEIDIASPPVPRTPPPNQD